MDWDKVIVCLVVGVIVFIVCSLSLVAIMVYKSETTRSNAEYELWDAKCPFGHYWVDISGSGFIFFSMSSELSESYILKYENSNGELKTLMVPSTSHRVHVFLEDDNKSMWFSVRWKGLLSYPYWNADGTNILDIYIHVPDPKMLED